MSLMLLCGLTFAAYAEEASVADPDAKVAIDKDKITQKDADAQGLIPVEVKGTYSLGTNYIAKRVKIFIYPSAGGNATQIVDSAPANGKWGPLSHKLTKGKWKFLPMLEYRKEYHYTYFTAIGDIVEYEVK